MLSLVATPDDLLTEMGDELSNIAPPEVDFDVDRVVLAWVPYCSNAGRELRAELVTGQDDSLVIDWALRDRWDYDMSVESRPYSVLRVGGVDWAGVSGTLRVVPYGEE